MSDSLVKDFTNEQEEQGRGVMDESLTGKQREREGERERERGAEKRKERSGVERPFHLTMEEAP